MTPGTRVRLRHDTAFWTRGVEGTVVDLPERQLNGWEFAVHWDGNPADAVSCWNADEVEVVEP